MTKYAIVTGASKGVGFATCNMLADKGYKVIALSRNMEKMKSFNSPNIFPYQLDMTNFEEIKKFAETYQDITLDILINNAGGGAGPTNILNEDPFNFNYAYSLNVSGPMYLSQLFTSNLQRSENPIIVFVSSIGGKFPYAGGGNYTTAKRGLSGLVDLMRLEYGGYNIRVTEICPGSIDTVENESRKFAVKAEDVAEAIIWPTQLPKHVNINHIELNHTLSGKY
jgi:NADP-dependent 3-hydroxy acid dehydrogenase YdfG